jgi:3-mercaptopyruvate sulfurtransferase SseA
MKLTRLIAIASLLAVSSTSILACAQSATTTPTGGTTSYANAALLVQDNWLKDHVGDSNLVIIDTRANTDYTAGHIKNAINLLPGALDGPGANVPTDKTDLIAASDAAKILGQAGISNKTKIIVYAAGVDANAGRIFWDMEYLGASDVHVLDGGFAKWTKDNNATATDNTVKPTTTFAVSPDSSKLATKATVLASLKNSNVAIVDSRNTADYLPKHIPGAINLLMGDYLNSDGTVKSAADLQSFLDSKGVTVNKTVIVHCYVGYRSAQAYFIYRLMGYKVSNYDGSWTEWSADSSLPTQP